MEKGSDAMPHKPSLASLLFHVGTPSHLPGLLSFLIPACTLIFHVLFVTVRVRVLRVFLFFCVYVPVFVSVHVPAYMHC